MAKTIERRSDSIETNRLERVIRVTERQGFIRDRVTHVGIYVCKETVGTDLFSAHSFGDAGDFMLKEEAQGDWQREQIAQRMIRDATKRTWANRGVKTNLEFLVWGDKQWTREGGVRPYTGVFHGNHLHAGCSFSVESPKPLCAGGSPYLPGVIYFNPKPAGKKG